MKKSSKPDALTAAQRTPQHDPHSPAEQAAAVQSLAAAMPHNAAKALEIASSC